MSVTFLEKADTGSNKPEKYAVQLIARAYSYVRPTGHKVSVLKPKIDRLAFTVAVSDHDLRNKIRVALTGKAGLSGAGISNWDKQLDWGSGKYQQSFGLDVGNGRRALIQVAGESSKVSFLRFELNPDKIGLKGVNLFKTSLSDISGGKLSYNSIFDKSRVTRVDVAIDLINIDVEDVLYSSNIPGPKNLWFGLSGKAETAYINAGSHGSKLYVYDRKAALSKQMDKGGAVQLEFGNAKYSRVEVRVNPACSIGKLNGIKFPFKNFQLLDIEAAEAPESEHAWKLFQDSCRYRGLDGALSLLPEQIRKDYEKALLPTGDLLWRPEILWKNWPLALQKIGLAPD